MIKERHNISLDKDVWERLMQYVEEQHMNASQAVTQLVLKANDKYEQIMGQVGFEIRDKEKKERK